MLRASFIAGCLLTAPAVLGQALPAPTPPQTSVAELQKQLEEARKQLDTIRTQVSASETKYNAMEGDTAARLKALEDRNKEIEGREKEALNKKYQFGTAAYIQVANSVTIITFIHDLLLAEIKLNDVTSVWSDADFRNGFDTARDWGTIVGLGVSVVGAFLSSDGGSNSAKFGTIGVGAGIAVLAQAGGILLGTQKGDKIKQKLTLIDISRAAYDDLVIRERLLDNYVTQNNSFLTKVQQAQGKYNAAKSDEQKAASLAELESIIPEFRKVLGQIPEYVLGAKAAAERYIERLRSADGAQPVDQLRTQIESKASNFSRILTTYDTKVKPILDLSSEVIVVLRVGVSGSPGAPQREAPPAP